MADPTETRPSRLLAIGSWLAGPLCLCGLLLLLVAMRNRTGAETSYLADNAYLDLAVARTLQQSGVLGLQADTLVPATSDALWQLILSLGLRLVSTAATAPLLLGVVLALLAVQGGRGLAHAWTGHAGAVAVAVLLALATGLPVDVLRGSSMALSLLLVIYLLQRYLQGGPKSCWPLSPQVAWWAGLAGLVQVELLVIWLAVALHAVVTGPWRHGRGHGLAFPLLRLVGQLLIIAMVLSPALVWNLHAISVPWPRFPDAPLSLDAWSQLPPAQVLATSWSLAAGVVGACYARALDVPVLGGGLPVVFLGLGLVFSLVEVRRDRQQLSGTVGWALLLVPLFYALLYPYVGWAAAAPVFGALQGAWAVLVVRGIYRSGDVLCRVVHKGTRRVWPWLSPGWISAVLVTVLALLGGLRNLREGGAYVMQAQQARAERQAVLDALGPAAPGELVATDQPGWLAFQRPSRYIDLKGRATPVLLAFRATDGWQGEAAADFLRQQGVTRLVIWSEPYAYAAGPLGAVMDGTWPKVAEVR